MGKKWREMPYFIFFKLYNLLYSSSEMLYCVFSLLKA